MSTTGEEISVRFVGTSAEAEAASERASVAITAAVDRMKGGFTGLADVTKVAMGEVGASAEGAAAATETASAVADSALGRWKLSMLGLQHQARETAEQVHGSFERLGGLMEHLNGAMLAVGAALAGGAIFGEAIGATTKFTGEVLKLSHTLGMSTEDASGLQAALHGLGIDTDTYAGAAMRLTRQLRTHEEALNKIGIATRDAGGALLGQQEIMMNAIDALRNMEEGTNRNLAAQVAFGRGAGDTAALLRLTKERIAEANEEAARFGMKLDAEGVQSFLNYQEANRKASYALEVLQVKIGTAVLPMLTKLANWFSVNGPQIVANFTSAVSGVVEAMNWLNGIMEAGRLVMFTFGATVEMVLTQVGNAFRTMARTALSVLSGDFSGALKEAGDGVDRVGTIMETAGNRVRKAWIDARTAINATTPNVAGFAPSGDNTVDPNALTKGPKEKKAKKEKAVKDNTAELEASIVKEANRALTEFMKEQEKERTGLALESIKAQESAALDQVAMAEQHAKHETDMGRTTKTQLLQQEIAFAAQRLAIELEAISGEAVLAQDDVVKAQQLADKKLAIERKYQLDVQKLRDQAETKQAVKQNAYLSQMSNAWGQALAKMATLQASFGTTLQSMWQGLVGTIESAIAKMVESWIVGLFTKEIASKSFHLKEVLQTAKQAAAHAYNAVVGIPVVGPVLAPVAAGVAFAGVAAFSAEGGYDIPAGVNPVTQLHAREMVLPAHIADPLRAILASGGSAAASAGGDVHVHVSTIDSRGFEQLLQRDRHKVASAVRAAVRDGFKPA